MNLFKCNYLTHTADFRLTAKNCIDNAKNILNTARREDMGAISALKNQADDVIRQADDLYNPTRIQERLTPLDADRIDVTRYLSNQPISRNQRGGFIRRRR